MLDALGIHGSLLGAWEVLMLFVIPVGGGIPAGVVLAKNNGIGWPEMSVLYFISDVILACVFEPVMLLVIRLAQGSPAWARVRDSMKASMARTTAMYGKTMGPVALIAISFGVDPMTGRGAAKARGHGFVPGWALAITGDMFYFWLLMCSTLWLSDVLGDGTRAALIVMGATLAGPWVVRKVKGMLWPARAGARVAGDGTQPPVGTGVGEEGR